MPGKTPVLLVLALFCLAPALRGDNVFVRSADDPAMRFESLLRLPLQVTVGGGLFDGEKAKSTTVHLPVQVTLILKGEAPLKPGEKERFYFYAADGARGVQLDMHMNTVYEWKPAALDTPPKTRVASDDAKASTTFIFGRPYLSMTPSLVVCLERGDRQAVYAKNEIEGIEGALVDGKLRLHFVDPRNGEFPAETDYEIELRRVRRFLPDPLVATAIVPAREGTAQEALLSCDDGVFEAGKALTVKIRLRRKSRFYKESWTSRVKAELRPRAAEGDEPGTDDLISR